MPFKIRDDEIRNLSDRDLLILQHERSADMKEDLAVVLSKVLSVCEKQTQLEKNVIVIDARCSSHKNFPDQLRQLTESTIKINKDVEALGHSQEELVISNGDCKKRISYLEDKARLVDLSWKTVWGNSVLKTSGLAILLSFIGVYWGRVGQYGWHVVGAFLFAVFIIILTTWLKKRENRNGVLNMFHL